MTDSWLKNKFFIRNLSAIYIRTDSDPKMTVNNSFSPIHSIPLSITPFHSYQSTNQSTNQSIHSFILLHHHHHVHYNFSWSGGHSTGQKRLCRGPRSTHSTLYQRRMPLHTVYLRERLWLWICGGKIVWSLSRIQTAKTSGSSSSKQQIKKYMVGYVNSILRSTVSDAWWR